MKEVTVHPNIIRLHEIFYAKSQIFLIMELAHGGDLRQLLQRHPRRRLPEEFAREITKQLLQAVSHLHRHKSVVHRDLKCDNILFERKVRNV